MRRMLLLVGAVAVVVASAVLVAGASGSVQARWLITDLGLGDAVAINAAGVIVGNSDPYSATSHASLWEKGVRRDLGVLSGGIGSYAVAVSDDGQVVGWSNFKNPRGNSAAHRAVLWQQEGMTDLGTLGGIGSRALAISGNGLVVGTSVTASGQTHAFLWANGSMVDLGTLGGTYSEAVAVNTRGQVVGSSATTTVGPDGEPVKHAFRWQNGTLTDLGVPRGFTSSEAVAINASGQVVVRARAWVENGYGSVTAFTWANGKWRKLGRLGTWGDGSVAINGRGQIVGSRRVKVGGYWQTHAVLWSNGHTRDLGTLGGPNSTAVAVSGRGQVVGWAETKAIDAYGTPTAHAFLWEKGKMADLGALPRQADSKAVALNNNNQIVGFSRNTPQQAGVLWTLRSG